MNWFQKRAAEPSSWAGLAGLVASAGILAQVNEAPAVADAIGQTAQAVAQGVPWWQALALAVPSALAVILKDKGGR